MMPPKGLEEAGVIMSRQFDTFRGVPFRWTKKRAYAVTHLAAGYKIEEVARTVGVAPITVKRWKLVDEFSQELDRLTLAVDLAGRAERVRMAKRVVRQKVVHDQAGNEILLTKADLLSWLKYAQSEMAGLEVCK
jgi:hypothetical protein